MDTAQYQELNNAGYFQPVKHDERNAKKIIADCFIRSHKILTAIYGEGHPFITQYINKITIMEGIEGGKVMPLVCL